MIKINELLEFGKCFANESRIKIIKLLAGQELCVCELEAVLGQTQSSISQHLRILYNAGLVEKRRDGQWIYYNLKREIVAKMIQDMDDLLCTPLEELEDFAEELPRLQKLADNEQVQKCKREC